jgi:glycosyltransferase involved in cell wall biosynthesis
MKLSVVVPCFNEEEALPIFYETCEKYVKEMPVEVEYCFVDDGSKDRTLAEMRELAEKDERVHYVSFSRNFGKEAGLLAGLTLATGDLVVTMDVDLQDPPSLLPEMYKGIVEEGYDCVATRRTTRKGEPPVRSWFAHRFYHLINRMSETEIVDGARDYRMMKRVMVDAIIHDEEYNRFSKGIYSWVGFRTKWISYENIERSVGKTKWNFHKLFRYGLDGIIAYSTAPLTFIAGVGLVGALIAVVALLFVVIRTLIFGDPVAGWPSMVSIVLFFGGLQLLCLGILAMYISKIYLETKKRPVYIVREKK